MARVLREADVAQVIAMDAVIDAVDAAMRDLGSGVAQNQPRRRVFAPGGLLNVMFASHPSTGYTGYKSYSVAAGRVRFLVGMFDLEGALAALIEADLMGTYRTGAASAVAARALAPPGRVRVGVVGTGHQARTQVHALSRVLEIDELAVYGRDRERRHRFAEACGRDFGIAAHAAESAEAAVRGSGVVVTVTTSAEPVLEATWVETGALVIGAGSNFPTRAELPPELFARADLVVVDQIETAREESGDLLAAEASGAFGWESARPLGAVLLAGPRAPSGIAVFESHGLALWDLAAGAVILAAARAAGLGQELDLLA